MRKYKFGGRINIYVNKTKWQKFQRFFRGTEYSASEFIDDFMREDIIKDWLDYKRESAKVAGDKIKERYFTPTSGEVN